MIFLPPSAGAVVSEISMIWKLDLKWHLYIFLFTCNVFVRFEVFFNGHNIKLKNISKDDLLQETGGNLGMDSNNELIPINLELLSPVTAQYSPAPQHENNMFEQDKQMEFVENFSKIIAGGGGGAAIP